MKFAARGLIVIGWIYILLIIVIMSAAGGWSKAFNLSHSWSDTVVVTLTMLPGIDLVLLGDKLEIAARNRLAERCGNVGATPLETAPFRREATAAPSHNPDLRIAIFRSKFLTPGWT